LANEQVIQGRCERCDSEVIQKELEQWFFKITKYAERLLQNLEKIDWSERTKLAQKNWIGKSEGAELDFPIKGSEHKIRVFTTRPDTLFGATYVVLAPEHPLVSELLLGAENKAEVKEYIAKAQTKSELERTELAKEKTGVQLRGVWCANPGSKEEIPVFVADYVLATYGTGAIMAVPAHDERDWEFAKKYNLSIRQVVCIEDPKSHTCPILEEAYTGPGYLVGSGSFDGVASEEAKGKITKFTKGEKKTRYHLRDWLISRQRYWGPPIPIIYCEKCGTVPVQEKDLPVLLPDLEDFQPKGQGVSPLAQVEEFVKTTCPECGGEARRETDVSDTFLDSAWYFLRYPSTGFQDVPFDKKMTKKWLPVDMYLGGQEHAVLHLLYARFVTMALHDMGHLEFEEPFTKFRAHGLLIKEGAKMSKSKGNVVSPDEYFTSHGADTVRMYLMFLGPLSEGGSWSDKGIQGIFRFLHRVWAMAHEAEDGESELEVLRNRTIKKVTEETENLKYNTAIAFLMEYSNEIQKRPFREDMNTLLVLMAPFAPHITAELWEVLGNKGSVHEQSWPSFKENLLKEDTVSMVVQVNGKVRDAILVSSGISEQGAVKLALASEKAARWIEGKPKKTIFVKDKLINFVI
ncbi:MAG: leucine--tRNA ligase, partial [bacterium]|nr:leucine--tRNA ligase [bacterium]